MDLKSFFKLLRTGTLTDKTPVIFFRGNQEYPLLLCSFLIDHLRRITNIPVESIDIQQYDQAKIIAKCSTMFLGMRSYYWFYNVTPLDQTHKKLFQTLVASYQGPHCLIFFALQSSGLTCSPEALIVDIPDRCTKDLFLELVLFTQAGVSDAMNFFAQQLFMNSKEISLDTAYRIVQYAPLLGTHQAFFIKQWLPYILDADNSLFTLSQYLFAKHEKMFFKTWATLEADYSDIFWVSFWSEQVWRATMYIHLMKTNNRQEAEKMAHRLPFSFKNKGWFSWKESELIAAHSFLYTADTALKNGGSLFNVELFYSKLFAGHFGHSS